MRLKIKIREASSGIVREAVDEYDYSEVSDAIYHWTDGNFGCDCNRVLFFRRAAKEPDPEDFPCSEGLYEIEMQDAESGKILFSEIQPARVR